MAPGRPDSSARALRRVRSAASRPARGAPLATAATRAEVVLTANHTDEQLMPVLALCCELCETDDPSAFTDIVKKRWKRRVETPVEEQSEWRHQKRRVICKNCAIHPNPAAGTCFLCGNPISKSQRKKKVELRRCPQCTSA